MSFLFKLVIGEIMLNYEDVIKNSKAYGIIDRDINSSRISHVYLFECLDENFLYSFAEFCAKKFINLNEKENIEKNNLRIEKNIFPDVKFYGKDKNDNIDVSKISEIIEQSQVSPFEADKKIFVLLNIQNMNEASQNKILKTIEEPPENTYYFLCTTSTTKLLPTILSRVKLIKLDELNENEILNMLIEKGISKINAEIYANCSGGNAMFAEKLSADEKFIEFFDKIVSCFFGINKSRDVLEYSNYFTSKNIDKNEFFDIALLISRDLSFILTKNYDLVLCKNVFEKLKLTAVSFNLEATTELIGLCIKTKKELPLNVNQTALIDNFLFKIAEVKIRCKKLSV